MTSIHYGRPPALADTAQPTLPAAGLPVAVRCVIVAIAASAFVLFAPQLAALRLLIAGGVFVCGVWLLDRPKRAAARPSTVLGSTRRPPLRRMWRLRRPMPALTTLPPVGG